MSDDIKVTAISIAGRELPSTVAIDAVYTGDDADFDGSPGVGGQDQWKQPVRCATTASITIATALNAGDSIDGVTLAAGDRVLVKDQGAPEENGIYVAGTTPARAADLDDGLEVLGAVVYVIDGTANAGTIWAVTNTAPTVVDTDAINWAAAGGGGGSGITVQDEGTPLSTAATTLNFTGAGVTATGGGATKTIDIPGAGALPWFDVRDYGAVLDDTTDDTTAIQDTLDAIDAAGGGTMLVAGMAKITAPLTYTGTGLHVVGDGTRYAASRIRMATSNTSAFVFAPSSGTGNRTKAPKFDDIVIAGPGGASSGYGVDARNDLHMDSCFVYGFYDGVHLGTASYYSNIVRSTFTDCDRSGVYLDATNNTTIDDCRFTGAFAGYASPIGVLQYGIIIHGTSGAIQLNNRIVNCSIEYFTNDGILVDGGAATIIAGNYFETQQSSSGYAHVALGRTTATTDVLLENNYYQGDGTSGFWAIDGAAADRVTITGGRFGVNSTIGIRAQSGSDSWVLENVDATTIAASSLQADARIIDGTDVTASSTGSANSAGTNPRFARADHAHVGTINGVTVSGTPSTGQVPVATSTSTASWQTLATSSSGGDHAHVMDVLFSGDGATVAFELPAAPVDAYSVAAYVSGVLTEVTLSGSMLTTATFGSAPGAASNNVRFDIVAAVI